MNKPDYDSASTEKQCLLLESDDLKLIRNRLEESNIGPTSVRVESLIEKLDNMAKKKKRGRKPTPPIGY